jgi:hypothetical protein
MNTYKTVSKQTTLTTFRMNTYGKKGGALLQLALRSILIALLPQPAFPILWTTAGMCDREDLDYLWQFSIDDYDWESLQRELPSAMLTGGPPMGRFGNHFDGPINFYGETLRGRFAPPQVPVNG